MTMLEDFSNPHYLRNRKTREMLKFEKIELMKNADKFIDFIVTNNINHVVVTNTNRKVVEHFKAKVPVLNKLKNWIVREDYDKT
jgi:beta-phosphoglucomutase-like phosphatase (HAD superfamily)